MYSNDENLWLGYLCIIVGIPILTIEKNNGNNQRYLSNSVRLTSVLNPMDVTGIMDALCRDDCANITYLHREAIYMVQEMHGGVTRKKPSHQLAWDVINESGGLIKRWAVKYQMKKTRQCAITIKSQYR